MKLELLAVFDVSNQQAWILVCHAGSQASFLGKRIQTGSPGVSDEIEAMNRLMQIEKRTLSLPVRVPRVNPSVESIDNLSNADADEDDCDKCPLEELRREREEILEPKKHGSFTTSQTRTPEIVDNNDPEFDPLLELKLERVKANSPKPFGDASRAALTAHDHVGSSFPVLAFGRHESKVPPSNFPIRAFGRHESKVPPSTAPTADPEDAVSIRTGTTLPVNAFGRHESRAPPQSFVASAAVSKPKDRQSIVPPSTRKEVTRADSTLFARRPGRSESLEPHKSTSNLAEKPSRGTLKYVTRVFRSHKNPPTENSSKDSKEEPPRSILPLLKTKMASFRRKPAAFVAA